MSGLTIRLWRLVALALALCLLVFSGWSSGRPAEATEKTPPKVIILSLEGLGLSDFDPQVTPHIYQLFSDESVGLIGMRKAFDYHNVPSAFYATLGAGSPAAGFEGKDSEPGAVLPKAEWVPRGQWLEDRAQAIISVNKERSTPGEFGALGDAFRGAGLRTGAVGSPSSPEFLDAIMDSTGRLNQLALIPNPADAQPQLAARIQVMYEESDVIVAAYSAFSKAGRDHRDHVQGAEALVEDLLAFLPKRDVLIVMLPFGGEPAVGGPTGDLLTDGEPLSPLVIRAPGPGGLLISGSTRRPGIISITDLSPTIIDYAGLDAPAGRGMPLTVAAQTEANLAFLLRTNDFALFHDSARLPVLTPLSLFFLLVLAGLLGKMLLGYEKGRFAGRALALSLFIIPWALAVPSLVGARSAGASLAWVVLTMLLAIPAVRLFRRPLTALAIVTGMVLFFYLGDLVVGTNIGQRALLAGSVLKGGRYYGIGNPLMGTLFIFVVVFTASLFSIKPTLIAQRSAQIALAALLGLVVITIGAAGLGANFGGLVTTAIAFPLIFFLFVRQGHDRTGLWLLISTAGVATVVLFDVALSGAAQSHIGRMFSSLFGAPGSGFDMIQLKLLFNLETAKLLLWRMGGVFGLTPLILLVFMARHQLASDLRDFPVFSRIIPAVYLGATISLLVNDTGFESFLLILLYGLAALVYLHESSEAANEAGSATN